MWGWLHEGRRAAAPTLGGPLGGRALPKPAFYVYGRQPLLLLLQVAAKVEQAAQQQTQAVADLVQRQAGGGGGGQLASGGGTGGNGAPFQVRAAVAAQRTLSRAGLGWAWLGLAGLGWAGLGGANSAHHCMSCTYLAPPARGAACALGVAGLGSPRARLSHWPASCCPLRHPQTLDRATLVRMIDKDPDRYDDYLAMQVREGLLCGALGLF